MVLMRFFRKYVKFLCNICADMTVCAIYTHPLLWRTSCPPRRQGSLYTAVDLLFEWADIVWIHTLWPVLVISVKKLGQRLMATILIKFLNFRLLKLKRLRSKHHQHEKFLKLKENCTFYGISSLFFGRIIPNSDQCLCSGVETTFKDNFIYKKILY